MPIKANIKERWMNCCAVKKSMMENFKWSDKYLGKEKWMANCREETDALEIITST